MGAASARSRPRVLFLSCHLPYPPVSGGRRREHELLARLVDDFDVEVCAVTKTFGEDQLADAEVPWRHSGIRLEAEAGTEAAPRVARHGSREATAWIARNADRFDVVHVEGFYLWQHLPDRRPATPRGTEHRAPALGEGGPVRPQAARRVSQSAPAQASRSHPSR